MVRVAETYEERADLAEYQAEVLESMLYRFIRASQGSEVPGLEELREEWKKYRDQNGYFE